MDYQATWMLLGREMFERCRTMNDGSRCAAGLPIFFLTRHMMVLIVGGIPRLRISRSYPGRQKLEQAEFGIGFLSDENTLATTKTLTIDEKGLCLITGSVTQLSIRETCQELWDTVCVAQKKTEPRT
jgi:hypothetical protein